ncbi:DUF554 domain-containing protein [Clostridium malenominatum]|uniref:DUF554 domain-containing protein n=1 Tax=Clostridium malenominatum TaxID=1539 RepID=UPI0031CE22EB
MIILLGVLVNGAAVAIGSSIGLLFKKGIKEKFRITVMNGLALCVILIGVSGSLKSKDLNSIILSMVIGSIIGEFIDIDMRLQKMGDNLQSKFKEKGGRFSQGFVAATLLMCVGAMSIVGSLESGLTGNHSTLYAKSLLDGFAAIIFASTYGVGVLFASVSIILYQGIIALSATMIKGILIASVVDNITAVGSLLIVGLGFNMLGMTKIKVANLVPAMFMPFLYQIVITLVS